MSQGKSKKAVAALVGAVTMILVSLSASAGSKPASYVGKTGIIGIGDRQSKLSYMAGGYVLKEFLISNFEKGNFDPRDYFAEAAKVTGYAESQLSQDAGYVDYLKYIYLPALDGYLARRI